MMGPSVAAVAELGAASKRGFASRRGSGLPAAFQGNTPDTDTSCMTHPEFCSPSPLAPPCPLWPRGDREREREKRKAREALVRLLAAFDIHKEAEPYGRGRKLHIWPQQL